MSTRRRVDSTTTTATATAASPTVSVAATDDVDKRPIGGDGIFKKSKRDLRKGPQSGDLIASSLEYSRVNNTLQAFAGGKQKSWMVNQNATAQLLSAARANLTATIQTQNGPLLIRKTPRTKTINAAVAQSRRHSPGSSSPEIRAPSPRVSNPVASIENLLPSPAPSETSSFSDNREHNQGRSTIDMSNLAGAINPDVLHPQSPGLPDKQSISVDDISRQERSEITLYVHEDRNTVSAETSPRMAPPRVGPVNMINVGNSPHNGFPEQSACHKRSRTFIREDNLRAAKRVMAARISCSPIAGSPLASPRITSSERRHSISSIIQTQNPRNADSIGSNSATSDSNSPSSLSCAHNRRLSVQSLPLSPPQLHSRAYLGRSQPGHMLVSHPPPTQALNSVCSNLASPAFSPPPRSLQIISNSSPPSTPQITAAPHRAVSPATQTNFHARAPPPVLQEQTGQRYQILMAALKNFQSQALAGGPLTDIEDFRLSLLKNAIQADDWYFLLLHQVYTAQVICPDLLSRQTGVGSEHACGLRALRPFLADNARLSIRCLKWFSAFPATLGSGLLEQASCKTKIEQLKRFLAEDYQALGFMQERVMATGIMPAQREVSSQLKLGGKSVVLEIQVFSVLKATWDQLQVDRIPPGRQYPHQNITTGPHQPAVQASENMLPSRRASLSFPHHADRLTQPHNGSAQQINTNLQQYLQQQQMPIHPQQQRPHMQLPQIQQGRQQVQQFEVESTPPRLSGIAGSGYLASPNASRHGYFDVSRRGSVVRPLPQQMSLPSYPTSTSINMSDQGRAFALGIRSPYPTGIFSNDSSMPALHSVPSNNPFGGQSQSLHRHQPQPGQPLLQQGQQIMQQFLPQPQSELLLRRDQTRALPYVVTDAHNTIPGQQMSAPPSAPVFSPLPLAIPAAPGFLAISVPETIMQSHLLSPVSSPPPDCENKPKLHLSLTSFIINPLKVEGPYQVQSFELSAHEESKLSKVQSPKSLDGLNRRSMAAPGALIYRIRCIRIPPSERPPASDADWVIQETAWPKGVFIEINNRRVEIRRKAQWHKDLPADITNHLVRGTNELKLVYLPTSRDTDRSQYYIAIEVFQCQDEISIKYSLESSRLIEHNQAKVKILDRLSAGFSHESDDLVINTATIDLDVFCPLSHTLIDLPVRGRSCRHSECFDFNNYMLSRPRKSFWEPPHADSYRCPICRGDTRPGELVIDGFVVEVLARLRESEQSEVKSITISGDGKWTVKKEKDKEEQPEKLVKKEKVEVICLDDTDSE